MSELDKLIEAVEQAVRENACGLDAAAAVAEVLEPRLAIPGLLNASQLRSAPDGYQTNVLHVAPDGAFSMVALVWLPGQKTPIHSHRCWCVVGVVQGCERENLYEVVTGEAGPTLVRTTCHVHQPGSTTWLVPPQDLHCVENGADEVTVSIHIYGMDYAAIGSSIFASYREDGVATGPTSAHA